MQTSFSYRALARESLQNHWLEAALAYGLFFVMTLTLAGTSSVCQLGWFQYHAWAEGSLSGFIMVITATLLLPLQFAFFNSLLLLVRRYEGSVYDNMFHNLRTLFTRFVPTCLLMMLIVIAASVVTLGIAGIILGYAYRMVSYLMQDYPELTAREALETSRKMMRGHKWDLFLLDFSFIGWMLLSVLTCGIGMVFVMPYVYTASAHFYEDLKAERIEESE